ncbi:IS3 family transposase [Streptomyces syringium]|uniref:IS3 family transposase n=1 Tax=Streptomyces syringium TaxID=76729 RepID=UPI003F57B050
MRLGTEEYAYTVEFMCQRLGVSKSGYYDWRSRPDSATEKRREELKTLIRKAFEMSDSTYGYRRVHAQLARWGVTAGLELVRQLMRALGLVPCQPKPKRLSLTRAGAGRCPTSSAGTSRPTPLAKNSSAISLTSKPVRAGSIWRRSSTAVRRRSSGTPWTTIIRAL